jgi:hypothetical protein
MRKPYKPHQKPNYPRNPVNPEDTPADIPYGAKSPKDQLKERKKIAATREAIVDSYMTPPPYHTDRHSELGEPTKIELMHDRLAKTSPVSPGAFIILPGTSKPNEKPAKGKRAR